MSESRAVELVREFWGWPGDFETADAGDGSLDITGAGVFGGTYAELNWSCVNVICGNGSLYGMWV